MVFKFGLEIKLKEKDEKICDSVHGLYRVVINFTRKVCV
jgi:hypothetical protein